MIIQDAIKLARKHVDKDPHLAVFIVRDYEELEQFDLHDLAWSMYRNYCTVKEAIWLLDEIEKGLA